MTGITGPKPNLRYILSDAIIDLCRKESFYIAELRIEGTICVVSDRSSALIIQITEHVGEKTSDAETEELTTQHVYPVVDDEEVLIEEENLVGINHENEDAESAILMHDENKNNQNENVHFTNKTEGRHQCPFCPKRYSFKHSLKDHINKHTGSRPHQCKHCVLRFMHLSSLCAHVRRRHSQAMLAKFECTICHDFFTTEQFLKQHYTWKHKGDRSGTKSCKSGSKSRSVGEYNNWNRNGKALPEDHSWMLHSRNSTAARDKHDPGNQHSVKTEPNFATKEGFKSLSSRRSSVHDSQAGVQSSLSAFSNFPFSNAGSSFTPFSTYPTMSQSNAFVGLAVYDFGEQSEGATIQRSADGKFQCPHCEKSYNFKH